MAKEETDKIKKLLEKERVEYQIFEHEPVYTSEQAAKVRRVKLKTGVKALVFKTEKEYVLALVAADRKIDSKKLKKIMNAKSLRLATPEEVVIRTGCLVGSVHPFGNLMDIRTYMDESILENELVNFNIGQHTISVRMKSEDLKIIVSPRIVKISKSL